MNPAEIEAAIALANGALSLLQGILPTIQNLSASGAVTPEQQAAVKAKVDALRVVISGPEWAHS